MSEIRELGFSDNKTRAFLELADNIVSGRLNFDSLERMNNEAVVASLLKLRGVGRWTAEYVLLRGLKRLNVFPGDDVGARNRLAKWLKRNEPLDYDGVARLGTGSLMRGWCISTCCWRAFQRPMD